MKQNKSNLFIYFIFGLDISADDITGIFAQQIENRREKAQNKYFDFSSHFDSSMNRIKPMPEHRLEIHVILYLQNLPNSWWTPESIFTFNVRKNDRNYWISLWYNYFTIIINRFNLKYETLLSK